MTLSASSEESLSKLSYRGCKTTGMDDGPIDALVRVKLAVLPEGTTSAWSWSDGVGRVILAVGLSAAERAGEIAQFLAAAPITSHLAA